ncbi:MAG TPA: 2-succinyl-5-enolpyruvyl-6-hydroxy-3-cyclohexene-1-carboxylic-acid synthase [Kiritimatiellia bacterium]|nr:2-succinyl-5-enolpyruvyl-6-hydroxy-3-cyclohexene-1-carboxylic-acid synthase [Kiritimatiellia bacterium]HMP00228.1 2-succinyl-5-enolpyruvyl-6-hydroxy-3-cyclohexene-1-carboxylic-acid synthase [Kiritimatiellia bacterium]HMP97181.1 2-succinyl-5-enolpyruvyl-6-hydroxy-3-cyclohexene-1-carboxylic-acid synthase [Kiritimatiellia bacterium]
MKPTPNINYAWSELMIRELNRLGAGAFFLAPGSRSSPLALSAVEWGEKTLVHMDERALGFVALGYARATGRPAVVVTTSGSAAANLWPAVCEASLDAVPLILLTADRPPELRDTGANQTMDQVKLFGDYVRWFADVPCPDMALRPEYVLSTVDHAYFKAMHGHPGPVHLNQMFREPLAPSPGDDRTEAWRRSLKTWWKSDEPWTSTYPSSCDASLAAVAPLLAQARRGVIVAGALRNSEEREAVLAAAKRLRWPVLPDIRSGLRLGRSARGVITMADHILLSERVRARMRPDVVLHLGGRVTSKRIQQWVRDSGAAVIMVNNLPVRMDPDHQIAQRLVTDLHPGLAWPSATRTPAGWSRKWQELNARVTTAWRAMWRESETITEPAVAAGISEWLPDHHRLVLASSMPIRDMEMYGGRTQAAVPVSANRGVSGIDGNLATAVGVAIGSGQPVTIILGDLALLHDLNSLALLKKSPVPVIAVVVNNNGGGIFSFLPVADIPRHFETCFGTPHDLSGFSDAASLFDLDYAGPKTMTELKKVYRAALTSGASTLIEVQTDRTENLKEHQRIQMALQNLK